MADSVLFLGNGPNNIAGDNTWQDLIANIVAFIGATGQIDIKDKPFPLLYEELIVEALKNRRKTEREVKNYIADKTRIFYKNEIHERIATNDIRNIVTTNYDYTIENAIMLGKIRDVKFVKFGTSINK